MISLSNSQLSHVVSSDYFSSSRLFVFLGISYAEFLEALWLICLQTLHRLSVPTSQEIHVVLASHFPEQIFPRASGLLHFGFCVDVSPFPFILGVPSVFLISLIFPFLNLLSFWWITVSLDFGDSFCKFIFQLSVSNSFCCLTHLSKQFF